MDFEDMQGLQIEDLGRFLSDHMPESGGEDWKGFSLGYAEEETGGAGADESSAANDSSLSSRSQGPMHSLMSSSLPNSPFPGALLSRQALDSAMSEFSDFSLEDKVRETKKAPLPTIARSSMVTQSTSEAISQSAPLWTIASQQPTVAPKESTPTSMKRTFGVMQSCDGSSCGTIGSISTAVDDEDDRGYRKKSREKMRRQEVNVKFDELTQLLGMNDKVRKSAVLQEAIIAIKNLQRERDELRLDRDRMKQEVSKLASCLQFSHMGSMVAANAMAMTQMPPPPTGAPFPINGGFGVNFNPFIPPLPPVSSVCPPIAPKMELKPSSKSS
ncbi:hypothetical protein AeMF1_009261 [Aphanomyces euteiches]|nr:hypothetical protein AeMF1_009261 [Aphanomyces euteiches]KAH9185721.1 hypothetical protein AeNC1_012304 [Aphanomyces euteiches]